MSCPLCMLEFAHLLPQASATSTGLRAAMSTAQGALHHVEPAREGLMLPEQVDALQRRLAHGCQVLLQLRGCPSSFKMKFT